MKNWNHLTLLIKNHVLYGAINRSSLSMHFSNKIYIYERDQWTYISRELIKVSEAKSSTVKIVHLQFSTMPFEKKLKILKTPDLIVCNCRVCIRTAITKQWVNIIGFYVTVLRFYALIMEYFSQAKPYVIFHTKHF